MNYAAYNTFKDISKVAGMIKQQLLSATEIVISAHASKRFRERFRLIYHKDVFHHSRIRFFLKEKFKLGRSTDFALKQSIGKYRALCHKHGRMLHFSRTDDINFVYCIVQNKIVILTVWLIKNV